MQAHVVAGIHRNQFLKIFLGFGGVGNNTQVPEAFLEHEGIVVGRLRFVLQFRDDFFKILRRLLLVDGIEQCHTGLEIRAEIRRVQVFGNDLLLEAPEKYNRNPDHRAHPSSIKIRSDLAFSRNDKPRPLFDPPGRWHRHDRQPGHGLV